MIAFAILAGGLAGLALFGFWAGGLSFREWAEQRRTPGAWLVLVFVIFPLCGVAYLGLEVVAGALHERWPDKTTDPLWRRVLWLAGFLAMAALVTVAFWVVRAIVI